MLDDVVFYIVPRLNPDGAALGLAEKPAYVRSGTRPYPFMEPVAGLHEEDIEGDGRILQMRISDPHGDWKISSLDARLTQKRGPDEHGDRYYRLLPEGRVEDFHGVKIALGVILRPFSTRPDEKMETGGLWVYELMGERGKELPEGVILSSGQAKTEMGHLEGRSGKLSVSTIFAASPTDNRAWAEWILRGQPGAEVKVRIRSDRIGSLQDSVVLR